MTKTADYITFDTKEVFEDEIVEIGKQIEDKTRGSVNNCNKII